MKYTALLLLLFLLPVQAEIYRWVDESGNVVFSDEAQVGAEKIELPPATTYTPVEQETDNTLKLSPDENDEETTLSVPDYQIRIVAPANDESIWINNGDITVSMIVEPELDTERGDKIVLELDGQSVAESLASTTFQLKNLSRGSHRLMASVVDNNGTVLANTGELIFHLHRASRLNSLNQGGGNSPGPTGGQPPAGNN